MTDPAIIRAICRYPVKDLSAERLPAAAFRPGEPLAGDVIVAAADGG